MRKLVLITIGLLLFSSQKQVQAYEDPVAGISNLITVLSDSYSEIKREVSINYIYQFHTYMMCQKYKVDYDLALSVMAKESEGKKNAVNRNDNGTIDKGLMQINSCNYEWLRKELGVTDFYNPWQNIKCGVFILGQLSDKYSNPHQILMSYNMGEKRTRELNRQGIYSSKYSREIVSRINKIKKGGRAGE